MLTLNLHEFNLLNLDFHTSIVTYINSLMNLAFHNVDDVRYIIYNDCHRLCQQLHNGCIYSIQRRHMRDLLGTK